MKREAAAAFGLARTRYGLLRPRAAAASEHACERQRERHAPGGIAAGRAAGAAMAAIAGRACVACLAHRHLAVVLIVAAAVGGASGLVGSVGRGFAARTLLAFQKK